MFSTWIGSQCVVALRNVSRFPGLLKFARATSLVLGGKDTLARGRPIRRSSVSSVTFQ